MGNPVGANSTPPEILRQLRALLPEYQKPNGRPNIYALANTLGCSRATVFRYIDKIKSEDIEAAQLAYTPDIDGISVVIEDNAKPRVRVRAYNVSVTQDLPVRRVVGIGDTHVCPGMDLQHFTWIGRYIAETRPDNVLHGGDFHDFESCEFHSAAGSMSQKRRPAFIEDIEAGEEALHIYHKEVGVGEIPHDKTDGNHEYRVERFEELSPNLAGTLILQRDQLFARYRWKVTPYRHWIFFEGVGCTHVPMSIMQKPIGGRYPENTIGNQSTHSIIFAHTHRFNHVTVPKIGINNSLTITNLGSAMPHGYVAPYADGATTGLTYGIVDMRIRGGRVESPKFISLLELKERYA
jgi:hypothetical protein